MVTEELYGIGTYVRHATQDHGTGIVVERHVVDYIQFPSRLLQHAVSYTVAWLDQKNVPLMAGMKPEDLKPSARNVPKFATVEEAEAWAEQQLHTGNWLDGVDDFTASSAQSIQEEIDSAVEGVTSLKCGPEGCGCMDCLFDEGQHLTATGCECAQNGCACCHQVKG
jgi:hypothetical protein